MSPGEGTMSPLPNGPAAAAILASGVGCLALGILATLAAVSTFIEGLLDFYAPVGPLGGKTALAVVVWLAVWFALHRKWKDKQKDQAKTFTAALILVGLGVLGTFPPFYEGLHTILS